MPRLRTAPLLLAALLGLFATPAHGRAGEKPLREVIDAQVRAAWQREKITPPARCDDATFLRRVFLDLAGTIPSYEEAKGFLADPDPGKRAKLVERLLDEPRYARAQAQVWDLALFGRNPSNADAVRKRDGFKKWLAE